ncbi:hypothetical protein NEIRO02_2499 [Nematocida sp. AWRm79]|nr:hypothetical protein NEIRO02_2103 [Nematocida sp. AWRm79]KAI5168236.1 hypothetical protein NEIRO02_2499 [Nematocida sp. AWRm79]
MSLMENIQDLTENTNTVTPLLNETENEGFFSLWSVLFILLIVLIAWGVTLDLKLVKIVIKVLLEILYSILCDLFYYICKLFKTKDTIPPEPHKPIKYIKIRKKASEFTNLQTIPENESLNTSLSSVLHRPNALNSSNTQESTETPGC